MNWTRRHFLSVSAISLFAGFAPRSRARTRSVTGEFVELRRNVGLFTARGGTMGWLTNEAGSVAVDSQFS